MTFGLRALTFLLLALVASVNALGCSQDSRRCPDESAEGTPIDASLMAFLSRARAAHHLADLEEDEEPAKSVQALVSVVDGPIPRRSGATPVEAREVLADTQARIAELQSRVKQFDDAQKRIDVALGYVPEVSYFRGHLFETRGLVEQRRADELRSLGRSQEAEAAKTRALAAFEVAMQIQSDVIRQTPADSAIAPTASSSPHSPPQHPATPKQSSTRGTEP